MSIKPSVVVASALTAACVLCFVLASPLVPIADPQVWLWIGLATAAAATAAWVSALRSQSERDQQKLQP